MVLFATTYRVNEQTGDPLLVQLVGTAFMAPMFLGGALAGTMSDRLDRHRVVIRALGVLGPLALLMGLAVAADTAPVWVSYVFVFCVGAGNVIDMTSRRTLAFTLVGTGLITNAAAFETMALQGGGMLGNLTGGAVIEAFGVAAVYVGVGFIYGICIGLVVVARRRSDAAGILTLLAREPTEPSSVGDDLRAGIGLVRSNRLLRQFLVTTVLMNFFYFAFMPLVPVFASDLGVGPLLTGLLASAAGMGSIIGASIIARTQPAPRGLLHIAGSLGAMVMLVAFANLNWYPAAFGSLVLAGLFASGFGATQSALVVTLVEEPLRGRALGVLSMAIGALPFGMFSLGLIARRTNPQLALTISVTTGFVLLVLWQAFRPHLRTLR